MSCFCAFEAGQSSVTGCFPVLLFPRVLFHFKQYQFHVLVADKRKTMSIVKSIELERC